VNNFYGLNLTSGNMEDWLVKPKQEVVVFILNKDTAFVNLTFVCCLAFCSAFFSQFYVCSLLLHKFVNIRKWFVRLHLLCHGT